MSRYPFRKKSFFFLKDKKDQEVPWVRAGEIPELARPVVLINGAFDLLHVAHMRVCFQARALAGWDGTVIVALDSDTKVMKAKGHPPVLNWIERAATLGYMPVDFIVEIGTTRDMNQLVRSAKPDVRVQGAEYRGKGSRYPAIPKAFVREGIHTSEIIRRCKEL